MDRIEPRAVETTEVENGPSINTSEVNLQSLKGYFGLETPTIEEQKTLNEIYRIIAGDGAVEMTQVLLFLRGIENKLGATPLGEKRLTRVFNYLKVMDTIHSLEKQKKMYEG